MKRPSIIYLVTEDWYFLAHRLPMARAARKAGFEVHVATRVGQKRDAIEAEGFNVHPINLSRGSINPLRYLEAVRKVRQLYRRLSPTIAQHVTIQASLIGALAARGLPLAHINTITGLGSVFTSDTGKSRLARPAVRFLIGHLLNGRRSLVTVENADHKQMLAALAVDPDKIHVLPGSGVDIDHYSPLPQPPAPITIAFAGRMLEDKGVRTLVQAHALARERGCPVELLLAGLPDPSNHNSIPLAEIESWSQRSGVRWLGHVGDVRAVWRQAHIAVLASLGEGLPVSLLEAAACGRALIATDVPGCRAVVRPGLNGMLVPSNDPEGLAAAITQLAADPDMLLRFGRASRALAEAEFSSRIVEREILRIYELASDCSCSAAHSQPGSHECIR